jgi:chitodextrinase
MKRVAACVLALLVVAAGSKAYCLSEVHVDFQPSGATTAPGYVAVTGANRWDNGTSVDLGGGVRGAWVDSFDATGSRDRGAGYPDPLTRDFLGWTSSNGPETFRMTGVLPGSYNLKIYSTDPQFPDKQTTFAIDVNNDGAADTTITIKNNLAEHDKTVAVTVSAAGILQITVDGIGTASGAINGLDLTAGAPDTLPPASVTNLAVTGRTTTQIMLAWTAPADDLGAGGAVGSYDVRYSTATIDEGNWSAALQATGEPTPLSPGQQQTFTVSGLAPSTTYYFAVKSTDGSNNTSAISNVAAGTTDDPDVTAPAAVTNLAATAVDSNQLTLTWTATGDDGATGTATAYDIRRSITPITDDASFAAAATVPGAGAPKPAGQAESLVVSGLTAATTYYFAVKVCDEVPNWSSLSNVLEVTTLPPDVTPPAAVGDLAIGQVGPRSVELTWTAPGDDGATGRASQYDVRYATSVIANEADFAAASQAIGEPTPRTAGSAESFVVTGLAPGTTYWFAIKASDEVPNTSALSNVASTTTGSGGVFYVTDVTVSNVTSTDVSYGKVWTGKVTYDVASEFPEVWTWLEVSLDGGNTWQINKTHCVGHAASIVPGTGRQIQWMMDTPPNVNVLTDAQFRVRVNEDPAYYIQNNKTALDIVIDSPNECPKPIPQDDPYTMLEMMINKVYHQFDLTQIGTYGYQLPNLAHQVHAAKGPQMFVGMGVSDRPPSSSYPGPYPYLKFKATYIKIGDMEFGIISKNSIRNLVSVVETEKQAIQDALGIPKEHIIINWDHIHYTDDGELGSTQSVAALTQAKAAAVPVEMAVLHLRTGAGYNYTRYGQSLYTYTDGPIDDNLFCVLFRNKASGAPVGSWVRFTGHNIVMSDNRLAREMESRWGGVCAIFNGNAGTMNVAIPSEGGLYEPVHMADLIMAQVPSAQFRNVTRMGVAWAWTTYYSVSTLIQCTRIGDFLLPVYYAEPPCEQALTTAALLGYDQTIVVGYGNGRAGPGGGYYYWNSTDGIPRWQVLRMTQETVRAANIVDISLNRPLGDANGDYAVDASDLLMLVSAWGCHAGDPNYDGFCDFNIDGAVDVSDLLTLARYWGT